MEGQTPQQEIRSGHDLDVWGGEDTTPLLVPKQGESCIAHVNGRCPAGCTLCIGFLDEMGRQGE